MRIDSCRKCGKEMQVMQLCKHCNQPIHFKCNNCDVYLDDPIHQQGNSFQSFLQHNGVNVN